MKNKILVTSAIALSFAVGLAVYAQSGPGSMGDKMKGRILLQVEDHGEAWWVDPDDKERVFLGRPADAFRIMREEGLGITDDDLAKLAEDDEPLRNASFARGLAGKILLQVQSKGEAWFVNPLTLKRHFLGRPDDAFRIMRELGLGIKNDDLNRILVRSGRGIEENHRQVKVVMLAQNNSGEVGVAELKDFGAKTKVEIQLVGAPVGIAQPAHIHTGTCAVIGGIKFPLSNVVNGRSETMLDVTLDQILAQLPLAVNVHKSAAEIATAVSCGDITNVVIPARDRQQAMNDNTFRVQVELVGNSAEVTAKTEFESTLTERQAIVSAMLTNLRASRQMITDRLRVQVEDQNLDSRVRAEARVEAGRATEAKAEVRFIVASTNIATIIEATFNRLSALTATELDNALDFEVRN